MRLLSSSLGGAIAAALCSAAMPANAATESTIYNFVDQGSGFLPSGPLLNHGGKFYGVTAKGGVNNLGTLYVVTQGGGHTVLHSFAGGSEGTYPASNLLNIGGTIYGTTAEGGTGSGCAKTGCGTVFSLAPDGTFTTLHVFNGSEGAQPTSLTYFGEALYGVTASGGGSCSCGTVFALTPAGSETTVHTFTGGADGGTPFALINAGTELYGTTFEGGAQGFGTIFSLASDGTETVLHDFAGKKKGSRPAYQLLAVGTTLYGIADVACDSEGTCPAVFRLALPSQFKILHVFDSTTSAGPAGGLIALGGLLYGTTTEPHSYGSGSVFAMTKQGAVSTIFEFGSEPGQGAFPDYSLTRAGPSLLGMIRVGTDNKVCGSSYCGGVVKITP